MYEVRKRDGQIVPLDIQKIGTAIRKAFDARNRQYTDDIIDLLVLRVTADYEPKIEKGVIDVESIQDSVEAVLQSAGYTDVAKSYILYRKQRERLRNVRSTILDYKETVNSYVNVTDWRVKENSTVTYSVGGLILSNSGAITATTGFLRSTTRKLPMPTAMRTSTSMTCPCSPATVPAGASSS